MLVPPQGAMGTHWSEQREQWPAEVGGVRKDTVDTWKQGQLSCNRPATVQKSPQEAPKSGEFSSRVTEGALC